MFWNHRVMKQIHDNEESFGIVEVYYQLQDGVTDDPEILGWTADYISPWGEDPEVLKEILQWMLEAFEKPILDEEELLQKLADKNYDPKV